MKTISLAILGCILSVPALAQNESLLIGPGDFLHVQVLDTPELEQHSRVTDAGEFTMLIGGSVKVAGMTPAEAGAAIEHALLVGNLLKQPHVIVTVEQYATQNVNVSGQVRTPGLYPIATPRSILEALALAGGLTDLADRTVTIERHATHERVTYVLSNSPSAALDQQPLVYPGDTVLVARVGVIYVLGDVGKPGGYPMLTNDSKITVLQAIAMASGLPPNASPSHSRLMRKTDKGYVEMNLPLGDMQKGKIADMQLIADDIIYVPFSFGKNFALTGSGIVAAAGSAAVYHF